MYVGRLILVGASKNGGAVTAYRLASRSFPHRKIEFDTGTKTAHVINKDANKAEGNPLLTYPCLQVIKETSMIANGSHLKNIVKKISAGLPPIRAIAQVFSLSGPEPDIYNTPRIVGSACKKEFIIGIVSTRSIIVQSFPFKPGLAYYVATYNKIDPLQNFLINFNVKNARDAAKAVHEGHIFSNFTHSICTIASYIETNFTEISIYPSDKYWRIHH